MYRSSQSSWFNKWAWIHYNQSNDKAFCFVCIKTSKVGNFKVCASKGEDVFVTCGYTNWKEASRDKQWGYVNHKLSQFHQYCVDLTMKTEKDADEFISSKHEKHKQLTMLTCTKCQKILYSQPNRRRSWVSPDGSVGGGLEQNSNFHQLSLSCGKDDPYCSRKHT